MIWIIALTVVVLIAAGLVGLAWWRKRERPLKTEHFQAKWQDVQKLCGNKKNWSEAILDADKLLDEALKKKHINGKNMGERLVKAQRILTDNDAVWFSHKLGAKIAAQHAEKLKEKEVKDALLGIRQALKDLGALPNGKSS
jgi:hypothetical protein